MILSIGPWWHPTRVEPSWESLRALAPDPSARGRAIAALLLVALAAWATLALRRALAARRLAQRAARARAGERAAARLLTRLGYRVITAQATRRLQLEVDGELQGYVVQADFVVEDPTGARLVAEVKTGSRAPDPLHPPTRRQLLEYALGYEDTRGVLLVDVERGRVRRVRFPGADRRRSG